MTILAAVLADLERRAARMSPKKAWRLRVKADVWRNAGGRCVLCGCECTYGRRERRQGTMDHRWPRAAGGGWRPENLQLACRACNRAKGCELPPARAV